jgi:hypothetical protein
MNKPREYWIGIDEYGVARWLSHDPRFSPISIDPEIKCKEVINVREVLPIQPSMEAEFNFSIKGGSSGQVLDSNGWRDKTDLEKQIDEQLPFLKYSEHYCEFLSGANFGYELATREMKNE